jgi:lipoate-protein ligase A
MTNSLRTGGGYVEVHLDVQNGIIQHVRIFGDFFHINEIAELEQLLAGTPHNGPSIRLKLEQIRISDYLVNITNDELLNVLGVNS